MKKKIHSILSVVHWNEMISKMWRCVIQTRQCMNDAHTVRIIVLLRELNQTASQSVSLFSLFWGFHGLI
jgi:hypothetical protein